MNTVIQFSGGRTSGFMLNLLLEENGGRLPDDWVVCFENTGKEREETLEFIRDVSNKWTVPIIWLEYDDAFDPDEYRKEDGTFKVRKSRSVRYRIVDFDSASRHGEPFLKALRNFRDYRATVKGLGPILPNPAQRLCTAHLKIKVKDSFLHDLGWDEWVVKMGIRADEAGRASKMASGLPAYEHLDCPLIDRGVTKEDVKRFWSRQDFDLALDPESDEGNCDLCFLKATGKLVRIMSANREREKWWIAAEQEFQGNFGKSKPSFSKLAEMLDNNDPKLEKYISNPLDKTIDCFCGE